MTARIDDPLRQWKLSPMDLQSWPRWYEYSKARDRMFEATDTKHAPWYVLRSDDKRRARLNCLSHILQLIPYKPLRHAEGEAAQALDQAPLRRPGQPEAAKVRAREVLSTFGCKTFIESPARRFDGCGDGRRFGDARMTDTILVLNAGSSSIKFSVFAEHDADLALVAGGQVEGILTAPVFHARDASGQTVAEQRWPTGSRLGHDGALAHIGDWIRARYAGDHRLVAVGHRVTHGGSDHTAPVRVDAALLARLERLVPLSPLHLPHNLAPIRLLAARNPELPQVACFDTAMHRTQPLVEQMFALPRELDEAGVRRYGFHGLSYEYIASVLPRFDARAAGGKTVVLHLGNGASMCALDAGRSVATTMGLTPVDGLPMGTRSGALDPGVLLYLMDQRGMDARAIESLIYTKSGLLGVSGLSSDMRVLLGSTRSAGGPGGRAVRPPHRARAGLAGRRPGRAGRHRVHRGHRRARGADPRGRVPPGRLAGRRAGPGGQRRARPAHQHGGQPHRRLGHPHQRRADDRAPHARPCWQDGDHESGRQRFRGLALALAMALATSGCKVGPDFTRPQTTVNAAGRGCAIPAWPARRRRTAAGGGCSTIPPWIS